MEKREKIIYINEFLLGCILFPTKKGKYYRFGNPVDLPDNLELVSINHIIEKELIVCTVKSPSFPIIKEGEEIPELKVSYWAHYTK